jgi:hypothetical protein
MDTILRAKNSSYQVVGECNPNETLGGQVITKAINIFNEVSRNLETMNCLKINDSDNCYFKIAYEIQSGLNKINNESWFVVVGENGYTGAVGQCIGAFNKSTYSVDFSLGPLWFKIQQSMVIFYKS